MKKSKRRHFARKHQNESGYTLVEVIVAFFIFMAIAVPMIISIFNNKSSIRASESLTAICLLEQEAMKLRFSTDQELDNGTRTINGKEWQISVEKSGGPLVQYHLTATIHNQKRGELYFDAFQK